MPVKFRMGEEIDPEQIIGMKPDDLKNKLNSIDDVRNETKTLKDTFESGLAELRSSLKALAGEKSNGSGGNNSGGNNGNNTGGSTSNQSTFDPNDPMQVLAAGVTTATSIAADAKIDSIKSSIRERTKADGNYQFEHWDNFLPEIQELSKNDPLNVKLNPAYWENCYKIVLSNKVMEGKITELKPRQRFYSEPVSNTGGGTTNNTSDGKKTPTEVDIQQAKKFNIPVDKYMESKNGLRFVG